MMAPGVAAIIATMIVSAFMLTKTEPLGRI
jgi:hypothetical protein